ncbi:hypothetical protein Tco_0480555 [Tanacetum coccineum]
MRVFPLSLTGAASKWWEDESIGSNTKWEDLTEKNFMKFYPPSRIGRKIEAENKDTKVKWDPTNTEFEHWLASKFRNHETMDEFTMNALWDYWRRGDDEEVICENEVSKDENLTEENEIDQIFRIDTDLLHFETSLCQAFKEFNYLSQMNVDVLTKDTHELMTYEECKNDWIYERNNGIPWVEEKPWTSNEEWAKPMSNIRHE